jgi:hypothetical protein
MDARGEKTLMAEMLLIAWLLFSLLCIALGGWIGKTTGRYEIKKQAIQAGVAEWIVDEEGTVEFRWKAKGE